MVKSLVVLIALVGFTATARAQNGVTHERSLVPADANYELIQSPLAAFNTFRVNRVTGQVDQMTHDSDEDRLFWKPLLTLNDPAGPSRDGRPMYYVFSSGIAARWTFLVNVRTGATWQMNQDTTTKRMFWSRVLEPGQ